MDTLIISLHKKALESLVLLPWMSVTDLNLFEF